MPNVVSQKMGEKNNIVTEIEEKKMREQTEKSNDKTTSKLKHILFHLQ